MKEEDETIKKRGRPEKRKDETSPTTRCKRPCAQTRSPMNKNIMNDTTPSKPKSQVIAKAKVVSIIKTRRGARKEMELQENSSPSRGRRRCPIKKVVDTKSTIKEAKTTKTKKVVITKPTARQSRVRRRTTL